MKNIFRASLLVILVLLSSVVMALSPATSSSTEGPWVPCVGCEDLTVAPYPESGLWSNPELSPGSALTFEIQNGVLAGYIYTYTGTGKPEWLLVTGQLVRSERPGVMWELESRLLRVQGGSCLSCEYTAPDQFTKGMTIQLDFLQRNHLHVKIGGVLDQFFVPFIYGTVGKAYFEQQTPYRFPKFGPNRDDSVFIVTVRPSAAAQDNLQRTQYVSVTTSVAGTAENMVLTYRLQGYEPNGPIASPTPLAWGNIICEIDEESANPGCRIEAEDITYRMPIGNLSDTRFFAEAEDGSIIEGFRFDYD